MKILLVTLFVAFVLMPIGLSAQTPEWRWATQAGGIESDNTGSLTIDSFGNYYVTGYFNGTATFGPYTLTSSGSGDIFIAKLDHTGNFLWAVSAGGPGSDSGGKVVFDSSGNLYISGSFQQIANFGTITLESSGLSDLFLAKINPSGTFIWAIRAGGSDYDLGGGIAIDTQNNLYLSGIFGGTSTFGSYSLTSSGDYDVFVVKMDTSGNCLWAVRAGGSGYEQAMNSYVSNTGIFYLTGYFSSATSTFGSTSLVKSGTQDVFVAKLDSSGNWLWAVSAGGPNSICRGNEIAVDVSGNTYIAGVFYATTTFGSNTLTPNGGNDVFISKLNSEGNFMWTVNVGGIENDDCGGIVLDTDGNAYLTGYFNGTTTYGTQTLTSSGSYDVFVAKMNPSGIFEWAISGGGPSHETGNSITMDSQGDLFVTGYFFGTSTFGGQSLTSNGSSDVYVAKLDLPLYDYHAEFIADSTSGIEPLTINFTDQSTSGQYPIINWFWTFGDGSASTEQNPEHTYTSPGNYTVTLTVMYQNYQTSTKVRQDYITVIGRVYSIELLTSDQLSFGHVLVEEQSTWQQVAITNTGNVVLSVDDPWFYSQPTQFQLQWGQRERSIAPGVVDTLWVRFAPHLVGAITDTLYIANTSTNLPLIKIRLSATAEYVPPRVPENIVVAMEGHDAVVTWDSVTENLHGQPLTPDYYFVWFNGLSYEDAPYYFLAPVTGTSYTHVGVSLGAQYMFYRVTAVKFYRDDLSRSELDSYLKNNITSGMTEASVRAFLKEIN